MRHLFLPGGHLGLAAPVHQRGLSRTEPQRGSDRVHGGVAASHDHNVFSSAVVDRLIELREAIRAHEVHARQELIRGVHAIQVLARHPEKPGKPCSGGDEHSVVTLFAKELVDGHGLPDHDVGLELHSHLPEHVDFLADDFLREPELGYSVDENTAKLMQRFEDAHPVTLLHQISGGAQSGRTASDDGHAFAGGGRVLRDPHLAGLPFVVGDETLQVADGQRVDALRHHAVTLTLIFLWTDAAGDGRQRVVFSNLCSGAEVVAFDDERDEVLHLHADGTTGGARRPGTGQTAQGLFSYVIEVEAEVHFFECVAAVERLSLRHVLPGHLHPIFVGNGVSHCRMLPAPARLLPGDARESARATAVPTRDTWSCAA